MKIKGVKKAVGDYNRLNAGGKFDPWYGYLMLDRGSGEVWTDEFYNLGHNDWKEYHDTAIINLVSFTLENHFEIFRYDLMDADHCVTVDQVKAWAEKACEEWRQNGNS